MPNLMTKAEACEMLRLSAPTVQRLIQQGTLAAYRVGRSVRIDESSILAMLEASAITATPITITNKETK